MRKRILQLFILLSIFSNIFIAQKAYSQSQVTIKSFVKVTNGLANFPNILNTDHFACSMTNAGDLDGDGIPDIVVGAYSETIKTGTSGSIYILYLNADG